MTLTDLLQQWPAIATGLGGLGGGTVLTRILEHRRAARAQADDVALSLVEDLRKEMAAIRLEQVRERETCDAKILGGAAEVAALRHEVASYRTATEMMLLGIELAPEKAAEIARRVREILPKVA